jgi:ribosomal protein S18 acetylase RimI-like enzyme
MTASQTELTTRPLLESDLCRVVDIDARIIGRNRPGFFEKRLQAALAEPKQFIYIGCELDGELSGFMMARLHEGEYGMKEPVAVLDVMGVDPEVQGQGLGRELMQAFSKILEHKQIAEIQSQADWRNQSILRFFSDAGFKLAPRHILEREVSYMATNGFQEPDSYSNEETEVDYSDPDGDQVGALARDSVFCRSLQADDLDTLIRIDRKLTNLDRRAYYERKVKEALDETGIRVSLVAELKGMVVGFIMARVDYGEFDRTESIAVLDTIAVDPGFAHHHVGGALLAQLLGNLATLRLENIRTEIDAEQLELSSFLMSNNFYPAQRLSFTYDTARN